MSVFINTALFIHSLGLPESQSLGCTEREEHIVVLTLMVPRDIEGTDTTESGSMWCREARVKS